MNGKQSYFDVAKLSIQKYKSFIGLHVLCKLAFLKHIVAGLGLHSIRKVHKFDVDWQLLNKVTIVQHVLEIDFIRLFFRNFHRIRVKKLFHLHKILSLYINTAFFSRVHVTLKDLHLFWLFCFIFIHFQRWTCSQSREGLASDGGIFL